MRIIELEKFLDFRKKLDRRITLYYSAIIGIAFFVLILFSNFFTGLIWGIIMFLLSYGIIYGIRVMTNGGAEKKRSKVVVEGTVLDVTLDGEFGLLVINENSFKYVSLQKFGLNKLPEIEINEDLYIGVGKFKYGKLQQLKFGADVRCHISLRTMPLGVTHQFAFYDVEGTLEKVTEVLDKVNKFNPEKHQ